MTKREVFDRVKTHLLAQGQKALLPASYETTEEPHCAYRGANGLKCAAGVLITDEHYHKDLETFATVHKDVRVALLASGVPEDALKLVDLLQSIHDGYNDPDTWADELEDLEADEFGEVSS